MQHLSWFNWRLILLFALAGPPLAVSVLMLAAFTQDGGNASLGIAELIVLAWAYLFGVVPASLTGLILPFVLRLASPTLRGKLWVQLVAAVLVGVFLSWLFFASFTPFNAITLALLGGCSAAVCTVIATWLRVGPNNSFKPKPLRGSA